MILNCVISKQQETVLSIEFTRNVRKHWSMHSLRMCIFFNVKLQIVYNPLCLTKQSRLHTTMTSNNCFQRIAWQITLVNQDFLKVVQHDNCIFGCDQQLHSEPNVLYSNGVLCMKHRQLLNHFTSRGGITCLNGRHKYCT